MAPRETKNNAYSNFWGDKQIALWYVMAFSELVNLGFLETAHLPLPLPNILPQVRRKR